VAIVLFNISSVVTAPVEISLARIVLSKISFVVTAPRRQILGLDRAILDISTQNCFIEISSVVTAPVEISLARIGVI